MEGKKWKIGRWEGDANSELGMRKWENGLRRWEGVKVRKGQEPGKLESSKLRVRRVAPVKWRWSMDWGRPS